MTRLTAALLATLAATFAVGGCSKPRTEAVVLITTSGLRIPVDVDGLAVRVASRAPGLPEDELFNKTYAFCHEGMTEACLTLPATLTLFPGKARPADSVRVVVEATAKGRPALASAAVFTFSEGQSLRLDFVLYANCLGNLDCAVRDEICNQLGMCEKLMPRPFAGELDLGGIDMAAAKPDLGPDLGGPDLFMPDLALFDLTTSDMPIDCGHSAGPCCPTSPKCNLALLACSPQNTCVSCGAVANPCCTGGTCPSSGVCNGTTCVSCGSVGSPCCPGNVCNVSGTCNNGQCQCGAIGQQCCPPANGCTAGICSGPGGTCMGQMCGGSGELCCAGSMCNSGFTCSGSNCVPCGGSGQPCCGLGTTCDSGFFCMGGIQCQPCGNSGQVCCPGSLCNGVVLACATNNTCQDCGDRGEVCCSGAMCNEGVCDGTNHCQCGAIGQACCSGTCPTSGECDVGMDRCEAVDMAVPPDMAMPEDMTVIDMSTGGEIGLD